MTDISEHPENCQCEPCKQYRAEQTLKDDYPEEYRRLKHVRGQDSEPDEVQQMIPDGVTERRARMEGYI